jgi:hypothetical protein
MNPFGEQFRLLNAGFVKWNIRLTLPPTLSIPLRFAVSYQIDSRPIVSILCHRVSYRYAGGLYTLRLKN